MPRLNCGFHYASQESLTLRRRFSERVDPLALKRVKGSDRLERMVLHTKTLSAAVHTHDRVAPNAVHLGQSMREAHQNVELSARPALPANALARIGPAVTLPARAPHPSGFRGSVQISPWLRFAAEIHPAKLNPVELLRIFNPPETTNSVEVNSAVGRKTMNADKATRYSSATRCGHCGNVAPMIIVSSYSDTVVEEDPEGPPFEHGTIYEVLKCPACREVLLRSYFWHDMMESEGEVSFKLLYPYDARMPLGLPEPIEKAYRAAIKVKSIDANAFGVLVGRAVEMVCSDRGASGDTLHKKLKDLAGRGEIPTKLVDVADKLRALRNVGAHAELGELTPEEVPIVEDLCRAILDYIYTAPYLAERAEASLARLIKKDKKTEKPNLDAASFNKRPDGTSANAPPSNPGQVSGVPHP